MINLTQSMSQKEILEVAHSATAIPAIWILFSAFALIFLIVGLVLIDRKKSGYGKFFLIWIISVIFGGITATFLTLSPNSVQNIVNLFTKLQ